MGRVSEEPATVTLMIRVADYFCDTFVLEKFAKEYNIEVELLLSIHLYRQQKS